MTTEIRFFAFKSKKEKVLDRVRTVFSVKTTATTLDGCKKQQQQQLKHLR